MSTTNVLAENSAIKNAYKELLRVSYRSLSKDDKKLIRKAFDIAVAAHNEQRRQSGEAYIFHPIAVARIVASEIGLDATSIASALLHDVVEDNEDYTLEMIEEACGPDVARIVKGLTKINKLKAETHVSLQAENFRKMLLTINEDVRVIIIKIADRLHNMQTMENIKPEKQVKIASETLYIYAPLAHRIGLYNIKTELEDLGLKYTEPETYDLIVAKIEESKDEQDLYIKTFGDVLKKALEKEKIECIVKGRPKSIYSIRNKMRKQNVSYEEVYDKFAMRVIYKSNEKNEKFLAWKIYSLVTDEYTPNPTRMRDWISAPKSTGYEALHVTVMGPRGKWVEVQIRSERMNEVAEKGYAAHYKYKNNGKEDNLDVWVNKLQDAFENNEISAVDFVEEFKFNLYAQEIFVFTPNGELKSLPKGASALDFAYAIHTEVGMHTRGIKVNGKLKPLDHQLSSGDTVEVITSANAKPSQSWLDYTITARARTKIKTALKEETKAIAENGKEILRRKLKQLKIPLNEKETNAMVTFFKLKTSLDLFYRVGAGSIDSKMVKNYASSRSNMLMSFIKRSIRKTRAPQDIDLGEQKPNFDLLVFGNDREQLEYKLSPCCSPIPGDKVFGFLTINDGIKIHKHDCPNALSMQANFAYRVIKAQWIDSNQPEFNVVLKLSGLDQIGLVNELTKVISNTMNVNITSLSFDTKGGIFHGTISLSVKNNNYVIKLINHLKNMNGIDKVVRV
ncbi:MAG: RelA/SpoT family protein [Flavobacteriaceae bacterium]|nr:RelA/SpoT family protein [Flavobacteriaceae bacterium]